MLDRRLPSLALALAVLSTAAGASADPSSLPPSFAYDYGRTETPRSAALGALHALGGGLNAIFLNPANLGLSRSYHLGAVGQFTPEAKRQLYGGAVADSTRRVAGGMSFVGGSQDPDGIDRSTLDSRVAMAFAVSEEFHVGVGGRFLNVEQDGLGPLGWSRASGGLVDPEDQPGPQGAPGRQRMLSTFTFDAGITARPTPMLSIAAYGHNLTYPGHALLPTVAGGAIGIGAADFSVEVDAEADFTSYARIAPRVMAGAEYLLVHRIPIRAGYRFDPLPGLDLGPSHQVSGGVGYIEPRFAVEAAVRRTLTGPSATMLFVGLSYFVDARSLGVEAD